MTALRTTVSPKEADLRGRIRFQLTNAVADRGYEFAEVRHGGFNLV